MHTKKFWLARLMFAVLLGCAALTGCSRAPTVKVDPKGPQGNPEDVWSEANAAFRFSDNPRISDDWTRFREYLPRLAPHFSNADVIARNRLTAEDRKFYESEIHLNEAELIEVESITFRPADAHHLDECYLLRDAAQSLESSGRAPIDQAQRDFDWVMRNVLLHEQVDSWTPPAYTLRRGHGSVLERSLVFLGIIRQSGIEGCLVVVPETEPQKFLIGVLDVKAEALRLFDPRLEAPIRGKAEGIASLADVIADPTVLASSGITPEEAKKLEAWLAFPLYALAPRMLELQKKLPEPVVLHVPAIAVHKRISAIAKVPVKVWNAEGKKLDAAKESAPPNSPTRALRHFLSKQDGGLDETGRLAQTMSARFPIQPVFNFSRIQIERPVPIPILMEIKKIEEDFFIKYELHTRELFLRGKYEPLMRRQERIQAFARDDALIGLAEDRQFLTELAAWRKDMQKVYADREDPRTRADAEALYRTLWPRDSLLEWLSETDTEKRLDDETGKVIRNEKPTMLRRILAVGLRDHYADELAFTQAAMNHEKAARAHAQLGTGAKAGNLAHQRAHDAWSLAKSSWGNFYLERLSLKTIIDQRLKLMQEPLAVNELMVRLRLLESLHLEMRKYFHARLRYAECLAHLPKDGGKAAQSYLSETKAEIEAAEKAGVLRGEIKKLAADSQVRPTHQKRLDLLDRDWTEPGAYYWLKRQIDARLESAKKT
jgi:hypothetical protein